MDEQLKHFNKAMICGLPKQKELCNTAAIQGGQSRNLLDAQVRLFGRKREEEKIQQIVYVNNYKLDEFVYLLDVMNSVYDKVITNQPNFNIL